MATRLRSDCKERSGHFSRSLLEWRGIGIEIIAIAVCKTTDF